MEAYASAALGGLGYAFTQNQDPYVNLVNNTSITPGDIPSMKNIYDSKYWDEVRQHEFQESTNSWNAAKNPLQTGVVPRPAYHDQFVPIMPDFKADVSATPTQDVMSLTGETIPVEQFVHNNMQPFYKGSVTQNVDPISTESFLENSTGRGDRFKTKQAVECFFQPTPFMGNVCGMNNESDFYQSRIESPIRRNNDFPIEQVRVGPGLNQGYNARPEGGFQQTRTLEYAKPRTIDELRPLSRPKVTYEIPFQGPQKSIVQNIGSTGEFAKNRPDTYYEQSKDQWLQTTGAVIKQMEQPEYVVKPTSRVDTHTDYRGASYAAGQPGKGDKDDYGKSGVIVYSNARDETQQRSVITNVASVVKAVVAPFLDILKRTPKEYTIDSARTYGNMSAQIPEKPTLYDPVNHIMKTTIKETTVHDTTILNPHGRDQGWVESDDQAKRTVRETVQPIDTTRNIGSHTYKTVVINPEMIAKKTVKETTEDNNNQIGNVSGDTTGRKGAYSHIEVQVYNTQKQYISDKDHTGIAGSGEQYNQSSYEQYYNAEIDGTREMMNIKAGNTPNAKGANVALDSKNLDLEAKKLEADRVNPRDGNVNRIYQLRAEPIEQCEVTKHPQMACLNENAERLDPSLLASLKENPYNLSINPI
jgi:hypothetical protein